MKAAVAIHLLICLAVWLPTAGISEEKTVQPGIACMLRLDLPRYPNIARAARSGGTADAVVDLGTEGQILAVHISGVKPILRDAVEQGLRSSKYSARCGRTSLRLQFRFEIIGSPKDNPETHVSFIPPNKFVISTEPNVPMP